MTTVVVTGANRGIGLSLCRIAAERGHQVIGVCRRPSDELDALAQAHASVSVQAGVDVTDDASVQGLAQRLTGKRIDILINNAGILGRETLDDLDFDSIRRQFEVNALGPLRVTAMCAPLLGAGSKVAIVTSRMGSIADNTSGSRYGYRMSKAAVNMAGVSLAHDLRSRQIAVALLHPGFVRTSMTGGTGQVDASQSAAGLWDRIDALTLETSGGFWHAQGERLPW